MEALGVVFDAPSFDNTAGIHEIRKPMFDQALIAQATVKAFHICILDVLAS